MCGDSLAMSPLIIYDLSLGLQRATNSTNNLCCFNLPNGPHNLGREGFGSESAEFIYRKLIELPMQICTTLIQLSFRRIPFEGDTL